MAAQPPAAPELNPDDPLGVRYPNTARMWNYHLGGKDNFPVDQKASQASSAMLRDLGAPTGEDAAHENRHLLQRMVDYMLGQGVRQFLFLGSGLATTANSPLTPRRGSVRAR